MQVNGEITLAGIQRAPGLKETRRHDDRDTAKEILKGLNSDIHSLKNNEEERP